VFPAVAEIEKSAAIAACCDAVRGTDLPSGPIAEISGVGVGADGRAVESVSVKLTVPVELGEYIIPNLFWIKLVVTVVVVGVTVRRASTVIGAYRFVVMSPK
jgi:hypothetical protein